MVSAKHPVVDSHRGLTLPTRLRPPCSNFRTRGPSQGSYSTVCLIQQAMSPLPENMYPLYLSPMKIFFGLDFLQDFKGHIEEMLSHPPVEWVAVFQVRRIFTIGDMILEPLVRVCRNTYVPEFKGRITRQSYSVYYVVSPT